jgi:ParB-like chromosome segregation protein Spo0J
MGAVLMDLNQQAHAERLELIAIDKLIPYANNARTHSDEQIKKIQASIREFGFVNPVLIDKDCGIIAGHGRVEAAKRECMTEIPCVWVEHLTEAQKKAYILADNKLAELAGWDFDLLSLELAELADFDMSDFGFEIISPDDYGEDLSLPDGEKEPFQQMTFTLADSQVEFIKTKLNEAKENNTVETFGNENSNGNALFRVVKEWAELKI